ncbi:MAG: hypothetical protein ACREH4_10605 [Vitreimonas sp.]
MRRKWLMRAGAAVAVAAIACFALASAAEMRSGEDVAVTGTFDQLLFAAGDDVRLAVTATDDVVVAGGNIAVDGSALDHIFVAGRDIAFQNTTARDVFAAGGDIDLITGEVSDDLVAAGGRLRLAPEARVGGDAVLSGGRLHIAAPIGGDVRAAGGTVELDSAVTGDVRLDGDTIVVGPNARIGGSLTHRGHNVSIDPQAQIEGETVVLTPPPKPDLRPLKVLGLWFGAAILFGFFLMAVLVATLLPRLMNDAAHAIRTRPLVTLALGLLLAVAAPFAIAALALTMLGLPLAFLVGAVFAALWPLAIVGAVYAGAMLVRMRTPAGKDAPSAGARALWAGLAMIVFVLLSLIPVLGFLLWLAAYLFGLGAVAWSAAVALSKPASA